VIPIIALLIGAGASKPLGIPTTDEMAKEFLEKTTNQTLKEMKKSAVNPDIETVIQIVRRIKELPKNEGLSLLNDDTIIPKSEALSEEFAKTEDDLTKFIREKCLKPDLEKATDNYLTLLKLGDVADVKIFTTNYDTAIENVCKTMKIEYSDGFKFSNFTDYPTLDPSFYEKKDVQIFKLHGSVDWWSDTSGRTIFRLGLEIAGIKNINNLIIYPAQKEDVYNYPFNILQSILIRTLNVVDEFIVIGHKFRDLNIVSAIKGALEQRSDFKLTIVNPSATKIKKTIFANNVKVEAIDKTIENWLPNAVKKYRIICGRKNAAITDENKRLEKETKDKIIGEYESSKRISFNDVKLGTPISNILDPNQTILGSTITPKITPTTFQRLCPKCGSQFNQATLTGKYECPVCHHTFS